MPASCNRAKILQRGEHDLVTNRACVRVLASCGGERAGGGSRSPRSSPEYSVAPAELHSPSPVARPSTGSRSMPSRTTSPGVPPSASLSERASSPSTRRLIPLGTPPASYPGYGRGVAADVGVGIKGRIIDLWMPIRRRSRDKWGRRTVVDHGAPVAPLADRQARTRFRAAANEDAFWLATLAVGCRRRRWAHAGAQAAAGASCDGRRPSTGQARAVRSPRLTSTPGRTGALAVDLSDGGRWCSGTNAARGAGAGVRRRSSRSRSRRCRVLGPTASRSGRRSWAPARASGTRVAGAISGSSASETRRSTIADVGRLARRRRRAAGIRRVAGRVFGGRHAHYDARRDAPGLEAVRILGIESRPLSALAVAGVAARRCERLGNSAAAVGARRLALAPARQSRSRGRATYRARRRRLHSRSAVDLSDAAARCVVQPPERGLERQLRGRDGAEGARGDHRHRSRVDRPRGHGRGADVALGGGRARRRACGSSDGSGLSRLDRLTATRRSSASCARALADRSRPRARSSRRSPVAGVSGTLRNRLGDALRHGGVCSRRRGRRGARPHSPGSSGAATSSRSSRTGGRWTTGLPARRRTASSRS